MIEWDFLVYRPGSGQRRSAAAQPSGGGRVQRGCHRRRDHHEYRDDRDRVSFLSCRRRSSERMARWEDLREVVTEDAATGAQEEPKRPIKGGKDGESV